MENSFRAWNRIVGRYQYFKFEDIESQKGAIQWQNLDFEFSTGLKDVNGKEIFAGDFYRIEYEDGEMEMDYYIVTWIKEWGMFATLCSGEYMDYIDNGVKMLDKTMYWTFPLHNSEKEINIIGSIRDKEQKQKLTNYIYFNYQSQEPQGS